MDGIFIMFNVIFFLVIISVSYFLRSNYPKQINSIIGYRTKRSMASQEAWLFANSYSFRLLFKCGIATAVLQIVLLVIFDARISLLASATVWIACLIGVIVQTEMKLKNFLANDHSNVN